MQITSTMLRQIAAMPEQAIAGALLLLAAQLEVDEVRRSGAARRQAEYAERQRRQRQNDVSADVRMISVSRQNDVRLTEIASRVDNNSSLPESIETVSTPLVIPPAKPASPSEHLSFPAFWATYPKRAGDRDRKAAVKAFNAATRRASPQEIVEGAERYAAFCDHEGKTGTEFVRQARTWLNADGWNEPYELNRSARNGQSPQNSIHDRFAKMRAAIDESGRREGGDADRREDPGSISGLWESPRRVSSGGH